MSRSNILQKLDKTQPGHTRSVTVYPTGRFAIAHVPSQKTGKRRSRVTRDEQAEMYDMPSPDGLTFNTHAAGGLPLLGLLLLARGCVPEGQGAAATLGSSKRTISRKRSPRGSKGIGTKARDRISYCAGYLEWRYKRATLSFLTLTLPPLSDEELGRIHENWSKIVNRYVEELKRALQRKGIETDVAGATEIQSERLRRNGKAYPHLHLLFRGRRPSTRGWAMSPHDFRVLFARVVRRITQVDLRETRAIENVRSVRKSVAAYLGKYLSKCASKEGDGSPLPWHPSDWIILSRALRSRYKAATIRMTGIAAEHFTDYVFNDMPRGGMWMRPIEISTRSGPFVVAWAGMSPCLELPKLDFHSGAL